MAQVKIFTNQEQDDRPVGITFDVKEGKEDSVKNGCLDARNLTENGSIVVEYPSGVVLFVKNSCITDRANMLTPLLSIFASVEPGDISVMTVKAPEA